VDRVGSERLEETTRLGSYAIIRKLARGGMAELFLARGPEGLVVVKKILPKYADSTRFLQLFLDEARLAGGLDHPNIVRTYGAGDDRGTAFFAMEYLHGQDVRTILHRAWTVGEKLPIVHAIYIASRVAAALHYAHERSRPDGSLLQIVHRDVSPSNVIVCYDGSVKLVDFGVAKAATSSVKTRTGTLKGKISYMSPEQAKGSSIDRRSDIFSLGIVLWEMVTTQRLFRGENDLQTLQLIINQPPRRPSELQPACTPELERVILRALAQDPAARYQTAAELLEALEALAKAEQLAIGGDGLSGYLGELFSPEVRSWNEARAAGLSLADHLTSGGELTIQLTESDFVEALDLDAMLEEDLEEEEEKSELTAIPVRPEIDPASGRARGVVAGDVRPRAGTSGPMQVARHPTPPAALPVARHATPAAPLPVVGGSAPAIPARASHGSAPPVPMGRGRVSTPPVPIPAVIPGGSGVPVPSPASIAVSSGEMAAGEPWPLAHGSSAAAPGEGAPAGDASGAILPVGLRSDPTGRTTGGVASLPLPASVIMPGGELSLDPARADRLLRRGLWVAAVIVGVVVFIAIIAAVATSGSGERARPADDPAEAPERAPAGEPARDEAAGAPASGAAGDEAKSGEAAKAPADPSGGAAGDEAKADAQKAAGDEAEAAAGNDAKAGDGARTGGEPAGRPASGGAAGEPKAPATGTPPRSTQPPNRRRPPSAPAPKRRFDPNSPIPP
jgi:serine/threonine protein kinase